MISRKFLLFGILTEALYLLFFLVKPLNFADSRLLIIVILLTLLLVYIKTTGIVSSKEITFRKILFFAILFNLTLIFIWNITSDDLFTYISRSRVSVKYSANPYLVPYDSFKNDSFYSQIKTVWSGKTAIYGPVALVFGNILAFISRNNLLVNIYLFKISFAAINIATSYLVYKITSSKQALFLYSWNPIILFELVANNHIDLLMVFFLVISVYFLFKKSSIRNYLISFGVLVLSVLVKYSTAVLFPFWLLFALRKIKTKKQRIVFPILVGALSLILILGFCLPFWEGPEIFDRLLNIYHSQSALPSLGIMLLPQKASQIIFAGVFALLVARAYLENVFSKKALIKYSSAAVAVFFLTFFSLFLSWYLTALVALAALGKHKKLVFATSAYAILLYLFI